MKRESLEFFGLKFSKEGISLTEDKVKALKEAKLPETQSELRSFLGLANYCARMILNMTVFAESLWKKTHKNNPKKLKWSREEEEAFNSIKNSIIESAMTYFNKKWNTVLEVDAGPKGVGAVLYQTNHNDELEKNIIAFWSYSLSDVEQRYSQVEKEALAVVLAVEKFHLYLLGREFVLYTDNKAIELIYRNPRSNPPARIKRFNL